MSASVNKKRALDHCREWNRVFPIGTVVELTGPNGTLVLDKTWSHAGLGKRNEPVIFLDQHGPAPYPLNRLEVPGYERSRKRHDDK